MAELLVSGRIDSLATASGELFGRPGWEFTILLRPWRIDGDEIVDAPLRLVVENLQRAEAYGFAAQFDAGTVVRLSVSDVREGDPRGWTGLMVKAHGVVEDPAISSFVPPKQSAFRHAALGEFVRDRRRDVYAGKMDWLGKPIDLQLECESETVDQAATQAAEMLANDRLWQSECVDRAFQDLFQTWKQSWAEADVLLPEADWKARLTASGLDIDIEGSFRLWFDDGDLFYGHTVCVSGALNRGATRAEILG